jgi:predicted nucleic acid-binding protein
MLSPDDIQDGLVIDGQLRVTNPFCSSRQSVAMHA